jgi:hypothetical protein
MPSHIYMDESVRAIYLIVMILIDDKNLDKTRKSIRYFARKNRKNLHMFHATHGFKRKVLKEVMSYDLEIVIIEDLNFRFRKSLSRQICLRSGFEYISKFDIERIVLDRSNSQGKDLITYQKSSRKFPTLPENCTTYLQDKNPYCGCQTSLPGVMGQGESGGKELMRRFLSLKGCNS